MPSIPSTSTKEPSKSKVKYIPCARCGSRVLDPTPLKASQITKPVCKECMDPKFGETQRNSPKMMGVKCRSCGEIVCNSCAYRCGLLGSYGHAEEYLVCWDCRHKCRVCGGYRCKKHFLVSKGYCTYCRDHDPKRVEFWKNSPDGLKYRREYRSTYLANRANGAKKKS